MGGGLDGVWEGDCMEYGSGSLKCVVVVWGMERWLYGVPEIDNGVWKGDHDVLLWYGGMGVWEGDFMGLWYELWKDDCKTGHRRLEFMVCDCGMGHEKLTVVCGMEG